MKVGINYKRGIGYLVLGTLITNFMTGCASIVSDSNRPVTLTSQPTGADIVITNKAGKEIFHGKTPTTITLETSEGYFTPERYSVTYSYPGYNPQTIKLEVGVNGWYFGNFVFGGIIGMLIIDPATGAMWSVQKEADVSLQKADLTTLPVAEKTAGKDPNKIYCYSPYDPQKRLLSVPKEDAGKQTICPFTGKLFIAPQ
jgi:hypothetical protein